MNKTQLLELLEKLPETEFADDVMEQIEQSIVRPKGRYKPTLGELYWYVGFDDALATRCRENYFDAYLYAFGHCFHTKEEAEESLASGDIAAQKARVRIRDFIAKNGLDVDENWDETNTKYYPAYSHHNQWFAGTSQRVQGSPIPHFTSRVDCERLIEGCADDLDILRRQKW